MKSSTSCRLSSWKSTSLNCYWNSFYLFWWKNVSVKTFRIFKKSPKLSRKLFYLNFPENLFINFFENLFFWICKKTSLKFSCNILFNYFGNLFPVFSEKLSFWIFRKNLFWILCFLEFFEIVMKLFSRFSKNLFQYFLSFPLRKFMFGFSFQKFTSFVVSHLKFPYPIFPTRKSIMKSLLPHRNLFFTIDVFLT